jgi:hypothetical protein
MAAVADNQAVVVLVEQLLVLVDVGSDLGFNSCCQHLLGSGAENFGQRVLRRPWT